MGPIPAPNQTPDSDNGCRRGFEFKHPTQVTINKMRPRQRTTHIQANRVSDLPYPVQGRELPPRRTAKLGLSESDERQGERREPSWNERVLQLDLSHARASPGLGPRPRVSALALCRACRVSRGPGLECQGGPCLVTHTSTRIHITRRDSPGKLESGSSR